MKILFCGTMVPEEIEYQEKWISAAGNRFQNNMVKNLEKLGHEVWTVSYIAMPLNSKRESANESDKTHRVIVRNSATIRETYIAIKKCRETIKEQLQKTDKVFCYNIFYSFFCVPELAKKYGKKSIVILADYSGKESFRGIKEKTYAAMQKYVIRRYNTVIGLSANIKNILSGKQKFLLMEGGIDEEFYEQFTWREHGPAPHMIFMYAGLLSEVTGVDLLLDAMKKIESKNVSLVLTGKGGMEEKIEAAAKEDARIEFKGHLTYREYIKVLQSSDVLINPRNMSLLENQNNFPSKVMEYLATGKPIISTKFIGWEKFKCNIFFCQSDSNSIASKMCELLNYRQEEKEFQNNRQVAQQFFWTEQLKRVE